MTGRFPVEARSHLFEDLDDVHVVFHGINKSGSMAMTKVIGEAMVHAGRRDDFLSHYHIPGVMSLDEYQALIDSRSGRYFAVGHYLYGFLRPAPRRIWVTQFRHPLPRIVSAHQWLKNKHVKTNGTAEGFQDLSTFVRKGRGIAHSQIMQFGHGFGRFQDSPSRKDLSPEALYELSVEAIEREFTCIGIAEHFEESIFCFAALLGLPSVAPWTKDNRNKGRPLVDELTDAERDLIREVYQWDFALYDWALKRFAEQNQRIAFGPSLDAYKAACEGQYKDRLLSAPILRSPGSPVEAVTGPSSAMPDDGAETSTREQGKASLGSRHDEPTKLGPEAASVRSPVCFEVESDSAARDARIEAQAAEIGRLRDEIARIRKSRDERIARLEKRFDKTRKLHEATIAKLRAEFAVYTNSWSWRLTSPLRTVSSKARHLRGLF